MNEIMNMLEKVSLGHEYFKIALLLRESIFLNSILTNADIWYGLDKSDIKRLEDLDLSLLRNFLNVPCTVPAEGVYLELGCLNIETIIKARRLVYLHYLLKQEESSMVYQVFITQWKYPATKNEWTEQVKIDLKDFGFSDDLSELKSISVNSFKSSVKKKSKEYAFFSYLEKTEGKSKFENLFYKDLKMANYLNNEEISYKEAQVIFSFRLRMANFGENFRGKGGPSICPLCQSHLDNQKFSFHCRLIQENVQIEGTYSNIFSDKITLKTVKSLVEIQKFRDEYLNQRKVQQI